MKSDDRIIELDGLRGIAVSMVLVWHFMGQTTLSNSAPLAHYASKILIFGRTGVDLFFVLSGFLIIGILIDRRASHNLLQVFYLRRAARILPPYFLLLGAFQILLVAVPLRDQNSQTVPIWSFLFFLQNWFMSFSNDWGPSAISVTWSVAIEEQFYLFFPVVLWLTPPHQLRITLISIALVSATGRAATCFLHPSPDFAPYVNTLFRLDALCVGGVLATVYRDQETFFALFLRKKTVLRVTVALSVFIVPLIYGVNTNIKLTMYMFGHSYLAVLYGLVLLLTLLYRDTKQVAFLRGHGLLFLGAMSYSMYLFHPLIICALFNIRSRAEQWTDWQDGSTLAFAFLMTVLFCWLLRRLENRFIDFGHQYRYNELHSVSKTPS